MSLRVYFVVSFVVFVILCQFYVLITSIERMSHQIETLEYELRHPGDKRSWKIRADPPDAPQTPFSKDKPPKSDSLQARLQNYLPHDIYQFQFTVWTKQTVDPLVLQKTYFAMQTPDGFYTLPNIDVQPCPSTGCPPLGSTKGFSFWKAYSLKVVEDGNGQYAKRLLSQIKAFTLGDDHEPLQLNQYTFRIFPCRGPQCPQSCTDWVATQGVQGGIAAYDMKDGLCRFTNMHLDRNFMGRCQCEETCMTDAANQYRSTYPFVSVQQVQSFYPHAEIDKNGQIQWSTLLADRKTPSVELSNYKRLRYKYLRRPVALDFACDDDNIRWNITHHMDLEHFVMVFPLHKLLLFGIPKVGITEWLKFLRFSYGAGDYQAFPHHKRDRVYLLLSSMTEAKAQELLMDPSWTKAVFFRNPAERILSAYLDKFVGEEYGRRKLRLTEPAMRQHYHQLHVLNETTGSISLEGFVDLMQAEREYDTNFPGTKYADWRGLTWLTDPHWKPQVMSSSLHTLLPHMDFVGSLSNVANHTRLLLERVGLWESHGTKFTAPTTKALICDLYPYPNTSIVPEGFNQPKSSAGPAVHATRSKEKMDKYYTPELLERVQELFAWDYSVWQDLEKSGHQVLKGSDLTLVKQECGR